MRYLTKNRHGSWRFRVVVPARLCAAFPELPRDTSVSLSGVDRRHYAGVARNMTIAWWQLLAALEAAMPLPELSHFTLTHVLHPDGRREHTLTTSPTDTPEQLREVLTFLKRTDTPMPAPVLRLAERLSGIVARTLDANIATMSPVADMVPAMVAASDAVEPVRWLSEVVEAWHADQERVGVWTVTGTWKNTYEPALREFRELISPSQREPANGGPAIWDIALAAIDRTSIERYLRGIYELPKQQGRRSTGHSAKSLLGLGLPRQSPGSARKKIGLVVVFVRWACEQDWLPEDLLKTFRQALRGPKVDAHGGYRPFSKAELAAILAPGALGPMKHAWQYWAPLIALHTGARVREIADLTVEDIIIRNDLPCIWFRAGTVEDVQGQAIVKRVKTVSSERLVPIARTLLDLGLLAYVDRRRDRKAVWLWEGLIWEDKNGHARYITRWFARRLRAIGVKKSRSKTFHSFRSTVLQAFDEVELESGIAERMVGHKGHSVRETHYMRDPDGLRAIPLRLVREKLDAIDWGFPLQRDARFCPPTATAAVTPVEGTQP